MSQCYIGEIRPVPYTFAPDGWLLCDGSLISIAEFSPLYALIGTIYGGDGLTTFALPDLRSRIPVGKGTPQGRPTYLIGQTGGAETVSLTDLTTATHTHPVNVSNQPASATDPTNSVPAVASSQVYGDIKTNHMNSGTVLTTGDGLAHENLQPYLGITYIIAYEGIFPPRD